MRRNRFTDDAVTVMLHTYDRAIRQVNVGVVHPVLVLWSLLRWGYGMGIVALRECGIDQWSFERDTACLLEALNLPEEKELLFDFRAVSAVSTAAIIEAKMLGRID